MPEGIRNNIADAGGSGNDGEGRGVVYLKQWCHKWTNSDLKRIIKITSNGDGFVDRLIGIHSPGRSTAKGHECGHMRK